MDILCRLIITICVAFYIIVADPNVNVSMTTPLADPNVNVSMTTPLEASGDLYVPKFKLPDGLHGDKILLRWYWVTANQCRAQGYVDYPWPDSTWHPVGSLSKACESLR